LPEPGRPKNTYVREDQILPHLAAIAILLASGQAQSITAKLTAPTETAELIGQLRASGTVLTYDPDTQTIRVGDGAAVAITTGRYSSRQLQSAITTGRS
jgi:hypothetical protein